MTNSVKLHPRNRHSGQYDFEKLVRVHPVLKPFVVDNGYGVNSINFFDPEAVRALNQALLKSQYNIEYWDFQQSALTPPIPGRADYIHYLCDLLSPHKGEQTKILDIGVGANCIYPIIGVCEYGWQFVGSDIEVASLQSAQQIIDRNSTLSGNVELRHQISNNFIFKGIISPEDQFDATICNPPFHDSAKSAKSGSMRKLRNLKRGGKVSHKLNFAGQSNELWCEGGELQFVMRMIEESELFKDQCRWFTTLISKEDNLSPLLRKLKQKNVHPPRVIEMSQGNKKSRILAWRYR